MNVLIRQASFTDRKAVLELIRCELGYHDLDAAQFAQRFQRILSDPRKFTLIAARDDEIVGFLGLAADESYEIEGEFMRLTALAVREDLQGHGIGRQLVEAAEALARAHGTVALSLHSNRRRTSAHAFYERLGFEKTSFAFKKPL